MTSPIDNFAARTRYVDAPNLAVSAGGIAFVHHRSARAEAGIQRR